MNRFKGVESPNQELSSSAMGQHCIQLVQGHLN
jgi:hypothetical protein